jgi:glycosyltransferase involved in cell wall biosynthesis
MTARDDLPPSGQATDLQVPTQDPAGLARQAETLSIGRQAARDCAGADPAAPGPRHRVRGTAVNANTLVSIGLPVFNAGAGIADVVRSVLGQKHERIELVISDNASTDETEEVCRELARTDNRIAYHRQPENVGMLNNFIAVANLARGEFFRWIGDDDRLEQAYASRCLEVYADDPRLILVTTQIAYQGDDGQVDTAAYEGTDLGSDDPIERLVEMLRLLNESHLLIDPLYGLFRRDVVASLPRRNTVKEDEVFATRLALAGPWGHVNEILAHRHWKSERLTKVAGRLNVPAWQAHFSNTVFLREALRWLAASDLTVEQRRRGREALFRMYVRRQQRVTAHRGRKVLKLAAGRR